MGLDFYIAGDSDGEDLPAPQWAYSGFHRFRTRLAAEIGLELDQMEGFGGVPGGCEGPGRRWDKVKDPIVALLHHSDCDGELSPAKCRRVAPRLRELVAEWPKDDYDRVTALRLAAMMERAAKLGKRLVFC